MDVMKTIPDRQRTRSINVIKSNELKVCYGKAVSLAAVSLAGVTAQSLVGQSYPNLVGGLANSAADAETMRFSHDSRP